MDKTIKIAIAILALVIVAALAVVFSGILVQKDTLLKDGGGVPADTIYFFMGRNAPTAMT